MMIEKATKNISAVLLLLLMCVVCLSACGANNDTDKELFNCDCCGGEVPEAVWIEGGNGLYCYDCVINQGYEKCHECEQYYENDGWDCNDWYCHYCFEDKGEYCFLCWQSFGMMITITVDGEDYYICTDCATDYFANIEPMNPVSYCVECGKLYPFEGYVYEHYIFSGATICQDCLVENGYNQCKRCGKYTDDGLVNEICGYCIEKEQETIKEGE